MRCNGLLGVWGVVGLAVATGCPDASEQDDETSSTAGSETSSTGPTTAPDNSTSTGMPMTASDSVDATSTTATTGESESTSSQVPKFDMGQQDLLDDTDGMVDYGTTPLEQIWYLTNTDLNDMLIDFRMDPPVVQCEVGVGSSPGFEGTAVFTLPSTGELLFYTDGNNVHHGQTHNLVANGSGLTGDPSCTEPALITPVPGQEDAFYIFTNSTNATAVGTVSYSIIDLNMGPDGTVTDKNVEVMTGDPGEALDVLPHTNGADFWVLTYSTAGQVNAFLVDAGGVDLNPVVSNTGIGGNVLRASINHSEDFDTVLLTGHQGGVGFIATAVPDRSTGQLDDFQVKVMDSTGIGYQASFSPDATKIYYSVGIEGWQGRPHQYDLLTDTVTELSVDATYAATKLARDDKIYWVGYQKDYLAVVNNPDEPGLAADFQPQGLYLEGCTVGFAVPNQTAAFLDYLDPEG